MVVRAMEGLERKNKNRLALLELHFTLLDATSTQGGGGGVCPKSSI